jgi:hypothetical protein
MRVPLEKMDARIGVVGARMTNLRVPLAWSEARKDEVDGRMLDSRVVIPEMRVPLPEMRVPLAKKDHRSRSMDVCIAPKSKRLRVVGRRIETMGRGMPRLESRQRDMGRRFEHLGGLSAGRSTSRATSARSRPPIGGNRRRRRPRRPASISRPQADRSRLDRWLSLCQRRRGRPRLTLPAWLRAAGRQSVTPRKHRVARAVRVWHALC